MPTIRKRPGTQPAASYTEGAAQKGTKKFNSNLRYVAGFRQLLAASSSTPIPITLPSSGLRLLGIAVVPASGNNADIADCQGTLSVNNNNILSDVALANLNPNFVGNMVFFPAPQPLNGTDTIKLNVLKNNAGAVTILINVYYVPKLTAKK